MSDYLDYQHPFYAFDTFNGIPPNQEGYVVFSEGNFCCSLEEFDQRNKKEGIVQGKGIRYFQ